MRQPLLMADRTGLPFGDTADFEATERGLIDAGEPVIRNEAGKVVWDNGSYSSFLAGEAPDTGQRQAGRAQRRIGCYSLRVALGRACSGVTSSGAMPGRWPGTSGPGLLRR